MNLVTGGTGLVGCHILIDLLNQNQQVRALKRENSNLEMVNAVFKHYGLADYFSKIECNSFIEKYLYKKLKSKFLFVSNNFKFGYKRKGDVILLKKFQKKFNYNLIKPKPLIKKNKIVSSTLIRNYLESGKIEIVNKFLSRKWSIEGKVEKRSYRIL